MRLPGAAELFRPTANAADFPLGEDGHLPYHTPRGGRRIHPSGRERHDEKITVYISASELLALEQARLTLRADYGIVADRGRIVREAVAQLLTDFHRNGEDSRLVRRLSANDR